MINYFKKVLLRVIKISILVFRWFFRYAGAEFIYRKFVPTQTHQQLPTGFLWIIGVYIAFFGVASQRYENRIDIIENRANSIYTQLGTSVYKKALSRISRVQNMQCPEKPVLINPLSIVRSLLIKTFYPEMVEQLKETIEDWKEDLNGVELNLAQLDNASLSGANLRKADLEGANLKGANLRCADLREANLIGANLGETTLWGADLRRSDLGGADLSESNLWSANLREANFMEADLTSANLKSADLTGAKLRGAKLAGAYLRKAVLVSVCLKQAKGLSAECLCKARTLHKAELDQTLRVKLESMCPRLFEEPVP